jgi:anti-sigma regulatory factor (Ser/Thr protein kinase)
MTKTTKLLDYQFPAQADQLCSVRQKLRETLEPLGKPQALVDGLVLAVGEACMNIIQHAYGTEEHGDIVLEVERQGNDVTFRLTDFAQRKTRAEEMKSRPLDDIRPGGLGCHLMNEIMDEVKLIDCAGCGNVLQMKKHLRKK